MFIFGFIVGYFIAIKFGKKYHYRKAFSNARIAFEETLKKEAKAKKDFEDSIRIARECGVPEEKILHSIEECDKYFME